MRSRAYGGWLLAYLIAVSLLTCMVPAPARADFFDNMRRTFTTDIPHFFQDDIPCAFGGQPTSHTRTSCKSAGGTPRTLTVMAAPAVLIRQMALRTSRRITTDCLGDQNLVGRRRMPCIRQAATAGAASALLTLVGLCRNVGWLAIRSQPALANVCGLLRSRNVCASL